MKTFLPLITICSLTYSSLCSAQHLYGLAKKNAAIKEVYLATVDPTTGSVSILSDNFTSNHIALAGSTYDDSNDQYLYYSPGPTIISVNALSGEMAYDVPLIIPGYYFDMIQYNCSDSSYYGLYRTIATNSLRLAKLDPTTGEINILSNQSILSGITQDYTYDRSANIYFFIVDNIIRGFDMITGNIISPLTIPLPSGEYFENINFNCIDGMMYGTYRNSSGIRLAKVDLANATMTIISPSFAMSYAMGGGHVLDTDAGIYYFNNASEIYSIDITTGQILSSEELTFSAAGSYHLYYIQSPSSCECLSSTSIVDRDMEDPIVYPNPAGEERSLIITDASGRELIQAFFTEHASFDLNGLAAGLYHFWIKDAYGVASSGKFIKE